MRKKLLLAIAVVVMAPAVANAQTISNYNSRMSSCISAQSGYFRSEIVSYHTSFQPLLWWENQAYGQPYFDAVPGGGGNVQFWVPPGGAGNSYYAAWVYLVNANGTVAAGSQSYVYPTGMRQSWVNELASCVASSKG